MSGPPRVKAADGRYLERVRGGEDADDHERDVDRFGAALEFDAEGNLVSGTPSPVDDAAE